MFFFQKQNSIFNTANQNNKKKTKKVINLKRLQKKYQETWKT